MDEQDQYWNDLEAEAKRNEVSEYDCLNEYSEAVYQFTINRIISNGTGGKKRPEY